jgi:hypothetical protein
MLLIAVPALLLGVLYAVLSQSSLINGGPALVYYPAVMLYNYTAETLATAILLVAITLVGVWAPQALRRLPRYRLNGLAVGLALAGTALACWGSVPQLLVVYRHVDRAELGGHVYQLGVRYKAGGNNAYVLCGCDALGVVCHCRDLVAAGQPVFEERPRLVADCANGNLAIQVGQQTIYSFRP